MKKLRILLLFLIAFMILSLQYSQTRAWGSKMHKELALDAWYYMEHSAQASLRQKNAIQWFYANFNQISNPWNQVASGTTWPDEAQYVCFVGMTHKKSFWGHNFNSWYHFLDMYAADWNYAHNRHNHCRNFALPDYKGEHNCWDGYNYRRHEEMLADYDTDDIDSWAAWWIDDDNFCLEHGGTGLQLYEYNQGGKGENGLLIGSSNSGCYTKWDDDNPHSDFWNMVFAPVDNIGRAYYQIAGTFRSLALAAGNAPVVSAFYQSQALYYLGASLHAADAAILHHAMNSTDWGHSEIESWASKHYSDQKWFQEQHAKIKWYIDSYFKQDGIDPVDRPFRWLLHRLASVIYSNESIGQLWDRYIDDDDFDQKYWNYCVKAYPASVAFAVIIMEKFYLGKTEVLSQQAYDHQNSENNAPVHVNPSVKVTVTKFVLVDETNPEWAGSDDIYGKFTVQDGIKAENHRIPSSGDYGMDDGETKNLNILIFQTASVGNLLTIKVQIWDADVGDDDVIGEATLNLTSAQNWGKGGTYKLECKYPDSDGHMDVYIKIE
ncbi:MAG: hypothetical protein ACM3WV_09275 [Bacillota bacterium]